jgi:hypothetical protein
VENGTAWAGTLSNTEPASLNRRTKNTNNTKTVYINNFNFERSLFTGMRQSVVRILGLMNIMIYNDVTMKPPYTVDIFATCLAYLAPFL